MGLQDITSDVEEEAEEEEVEELSEELGIEDKDDLKELNERLNECYELLIGIDKRLADMDEEIEINRGAIGALLQEMKSDFSGDVEQASEEYNDSSQDEEENVWLTGSNES